jgi:hypothetical protein
MNEDTAQTGTSSERGQPSLMAAQSSEQAIQEIIDRSETSDEARAAKPRARSFKATLSLPAKGVLLGERIGHDWVVTFPADPGKETKDRLRDLGFEYRDHKWKLFTHAANRAAVETLAKDLKRAAGDEVTINDYPTRQVVLAFDAPPGDEVLANLREAGFHFRSDFTWNANFSPASQKAARDLIESLPDKSRSAAAGR